MNPLFLAAVEFDASVVDRFEAKVIPEPMSGCHLWIGARNIWDYGVFWWQGGNQQAHRIAFAIKHGRFPIGLGMHTCDVRPCVNGDHVRDGTQAKNIADMWAKGRQRWLKPPTKYGEENPTAKYTNALIEQVKASPLSHVEAARVFGVGYHTVWNARNGRQRVRG